MSFRRTHVPRLTADRITAGQNVPHRYTSADRRVLRRLTRGCKPGTHIAGFVRPADVWW
jgi:hypothetical protein